MCPQSGTLLSKASPFRLYKQVIVIFSTFRLSIPVKNISDNLISGN